ncbi:hypothetical protein PAMP_010256 [Pampus punctatissimus]
MEIFETQRMELCVVTLSYIYEWLSRTRGAEKALWRNDYQALSKKDGAHQTHRGKSWPWHRLIVAPVSGNPDRACALAVTREGGCLEIF